MSFLCRTKTPLTILTKNISLTAVAHRKARKESQKLQQPVDKTSVVIGKRKPSVYYPKDGVSDKTHPIHVKWNRPVTMQTCNPELSGDIGGLESLGLDRLDLSQPPVKMENSKALASAPEEVRRVLSLEFARRRDVIDKLSQEVVRSIQRHERDFKSIEVKIAIQTVAIRNLQHDLIQKWPYKSQAQKHSLTNTVAARRKLLGILREQDYKKYEWLLEKLNLLYKPMPWDTRQGVEGVKERVERNKSIEKLTDIWCDELKQHRLKAYRRKLESQQPAFLRRKADEYFKIIKEEEKLGLPLSVELSQIESWKKQADEIEARIEAEKKEKDEEFLVFQLEAAKQENIYR